MSDFIAPISVQGLILHYVIASMTDDEYLLWWGTESRCWLTVGYRRPQ